MLLTLFILPIWTPHTESNRCHPVHYAWHKAAQGPQGGNLYIEYFVGIPLSTSTESVSIRKTQYINKQHNIDCLTGNAPGLFAFATHSFMLLWYMFVLFSAFIIAALKLFRNRCKTCYLLYLLFRRLCR
jgi:hypothetical protein